MTTRNQHHRWHRRWPRSVLWLLAGFFVLTLIAVAYGINHAEDDLTERAERALVGAGSSAAVEFSGRDATLTGTAGSEAEAANAASVIGQLEGVRRVRQRLTVTALVPPPPPPTVAPSFGIEVVNDQVTLRGRLRDQSSADVLGLGAADVFGTDILVQLVRVDSDVQPAPWLSSAPQAFAALGDLETGSLTLRNRTATLRGIATSEEIRTAAARGVQNALGGDISLVNLIEVVPLGEATFLAEGSSGVVILSGEMPAQESIDRLMAAAEAAYGAGNVENALTVGRVASASWLGALPAVIEATTDLDPWVMSVERRIVRLEGEAGSEDPVARVRATATAAFPAGLTIISDISAPQVSAPPAEAQEVADQLTALFAGVGLFESGSDVLSAEATALLDEAIVILQANPESVFEVGGHTDSQGTTGSNLSLSQARAESVVSYLVDGGVDATRLSAVGYGEGTPIASNDTAAGRAQNRRIEFTVTEGGSS